MNQQKITLSQTNLHSNPVKNPMSNRKNGQFIVRTSLTLEADF